MKASTISAATLTIISALAMTETSACCGLGGGFGGTLLFPIILGSALILWPLHFVYCRIVRVRVSWLGSLVSSAGFAIGAVFTVAASTALDRQSGVLMIVALLLFLLAYSIVFRFVHRATVLKGLGYAIAGPLVYGLTALLLLAIFGG